MANHDECPQAPYEIPEVFFDAMALLYREILKEYPRFIDSILTHALDEKKSKEGSIFQFDNAERISFRINHSIEEINKVFGAPDEPWLDLKISGGIFLYTERKNVPNGSYSRETETKESRFFSEEVLFPLIQRLHIQYRKALADTLCSEAICYLQEREPELYKNEVSLVKNSLKELYRKFIGKSQPELESE